MYVLYPAPPVVDVGVTAYTLLRGYINVTCPDVSLNCLVLVWSTTDNPDRVHVGLINSDDDRTVVLSLTPEATDVSVVVYNWNKNKSIFSGQPIQLIPLTKFEPAASTSTFGFLY